MKSSHYFSPTNMKNPENWIHLQYLRDQHFFYIRSFSNIHMGIAHCTFHRDCSLCCEIGTEASDQQAYF
ncbi:hypothetical protein GLOIN_2v1602772 [Rhizophagus irregularis DAOM 181602=DAOM 197198]|uniref:Uncharacterized protein n=1 Tax=Rhizophagus irregularis (strain DAOM 181602 / DAOM 197198 / MUCL 43194) TaxID=747089 RepID=A0A2P4Q2C0_RHIID|nr:hypothetical protein GLOIN_2v1602772 [Rhizophagus irregularis DAOM 181602=DAOM 197198]POG71791.1 hypothetical protein GLOIN_2v1602772 [Rhizophagus irregularis DAOM 181602=DAOM 197198]|eukprot:XP_025178657.1 hypothetical protein GLOIN_2v1602772 [Rhizophagus irregularis DAOM 181602=DAOM 197198]